MKLIIKCMFIDENKCDVYKQGLQHKGINLLF